MSNTAYPLEDLLEEANDILRDLSPPDPSIPYDPGFISSFYVYPRGYLMSYVRSLPLCCLDSADP